MKDIHFSEGEMMDRERNPADAIHVIETGSVEVPRMVDGRNVRLGVLGQGEIFGVNEIIAGTKESPYRFRVIVEQKAVAEGAREKALS